MASNPQCVALAAAKEKKGATYKQIASGIGSTEQRVIDVCTGKATPTKDEFSKLAVYLDIKDAAPSDSAHRTK